MNREKVALWCGVIAWAESVALPIVAAVARARIGSLEIVFLVCFAVGAILATRAIRLGKGAMQRDGKIGRVLGIAWWIAVALVVLGPILWNALRGGSLHR